MKTLLLQLDGKLPNLALMRLAAHCRGRGDEVTFRNVSESGEVEPWLGDSFDHVYASTIFEKTRPVAERLKRVYPDAIIGGTGWDYSTTLESLRIGDALDYSIYPDYPHSIGFTQRGCRLSCEFCVVPKKEGKVRPSSAIADIWRGDTHPRNVVLLDNDFFGNPQWRERIEEIREGGFRVNFNQGINARLLPEEGAEALASIDYYDADFKQRRVYTAWDNRKDESVLFRGLRRLVAAGIPARRITVYMLIGYWAGETEEDWVYRQARLREFGCDPYPMPYVRNSLTLGFQRWVVGHYDRRIPWSTWKAANCDPRRLGRDKVALPLFDVSNISG